MLAFLGILLVFAAVLGGFLLERGNPWVLMQPAEILIICGSGVGRGYADQKLLESTDRNDPRNRRVSVVVKL